MVNPCCFCPLLDLLALRVNTSETLQLSLVNLIWSSPASSQRLRVRTEIKFDTDFSSLPIHAFNPSLSVGARQTLSFGEEANKSLPPKRIFFNLPEFMSNESLPRSDSNFISVFDFDIDSGHDSVFASSFADTKVDVVAAELKTTMARVVCRNHWNFTLP